MFLCGIRTLALADVIKMKRVDEVSHSTSNNVEILFAAFGGCLTRIAPYA